MKNYCIGLDIGTSSVGWSVIDENNFKVITKGGRKLWGVELFDEAQTAEKRRASRSVRRRYDRRKERIRILQEIFEDEMNKVDKDFFSKLKESKLKKKDATIYISNQERKMIKEYYKKYPTIYHLRKELTTSKEKMDIRLVYLAIHHIIKYRGNFLYDGDFNVNNINFIENLKDALRNCLLYNNYLELNDKLDIVNYERVNNSLLNDTKNDQIVILKEEFKEIINSSNLAEFIKMIQGDKFSINKLFSLEKDEDIKISFKDSSLDDNADKISSLVEGLDEFLYKFKDVYDGIVLKRLFSNNEVKSISDLMVYKYNKHKEDLELLKKLYKNDEKKYDKMFSYEAKAKDNKKYNYSNYISNKITYDDLKKQIMNDLNNIQKDNLENIKELLEKGDFLPRITDVQNGVFPYQLNLNELRDIINNQKEYYPFLGGIWKENKTFLERLLEFRIPYYVGPLNNKSSFSWLVKKDEKEKITPFNFNDLVDIPASAQNFISRMISRCTYLLDEEAMPNNSIYYCKYKVLNELKQIKIGEKGNERKLSFDTIIRIYNELFLTTSGNITDKKFREYIIKNPNFDMYLDTDLSITGYSGDGIFANNMNSYIDFFGDNGIFNNTKYTIEDAETIIKYITVFEDKKILKEKIKNEFDMDEVIINKICKLNYKGWGRLSKKLLMGLYGTNKETGEVNTILELLEQTELNFQQILFDEKYNFQKIIKEYNNSEKISKMNYSLVEKLATSPANKRGIYQALKIVDEIYDYMGEKPGHICIEMARDEEKKERKVDKKKQLEKIYKDNAKKIANYNKLYNQLQEINNKDITKKVFLYFIQNGKSLYSTEDLDLEKILAHKDDYEIDHIIPRTLIKDNSIDNLALVLGGENQKKSSNFVLPDEFRTSENIARWSKLKDMKLMSNKKYNNLCRKTYSEDAIKGFINRQLVETRQICINVANILEGYFNGLKSTNKINTKIVYLNAGISSGYRDKYSLFKFRDLNDFHHTHDAYLAAVLGLYKEKYFIFPKDYTLLKEINKKINAQDKINEIKYGYFLNSLDNKYNEYYKTKELFDIDLFNSTIEKTLYQNDIMVTKKTNIRVDGELYDQTIYSQNQKEKIVPLKKELGSEYGGHTSLNCGYFILVNTKKGYKFIGIPLLYNNNPKEIDKYIREELKLKENEEYRIIKKNIPFNTKIEWKNQLFYIRGYSSGLELANATQLKFDKESMKNYKYLLKSIFYNSEINDIEKNKIDDLANYMFEKIGEYYPIYKESLIKLKEVYNNINECNFKIKFIKKLFENNEKKNSANFLKTLKDINLTGNNLRILTDILEDQSASKISENDIDGLAGNIFEKLEKANINDMDKIKKIKVEYENITEYNIKKKFVKELFNVTNSKSKTANLNYFDLSDRFGRLNKQNPDKGKIIYESSTGIWSNYYEF